MTDRPKILLVLSDVDGTLVTEQKVLTSRTHAAVRKLRAQGILFAITSGRPPRGQKTIIDDLAIDTPVSGFNGGLLVRPDLSIIQQNILSPQIARQAVDLIGQSGLDVWVYSGGDWFVSKCDAPHVAREEWTVKFAPSVVGNVGDHLDGDHLDGAVKIVGVSDDASAIKSCESILQKALGKQAAVARSQPYYLDVTHRNANKGAVVDILSERFKIAPAQIATIGDQPNDTKMFKKSGLSIAMGNAQDAVKALADKVTASYNDDGFAKAMERYVLAPR